MKQQASTGMSYQVKKGETHPGTILSGMEQRVLQSELRPAVELYYPITGCHDLQMIDR